MIAREQISTRRGKRKRRLTDNVSYVVYLSLMIITIQSIGAFETASYNLNARYTSMITHRNHHLKRGDGDLSFALSSDQRKRGSCGAKISAPTGSHTSSSTTSLAMGLDPAVVMGTAFVVGGAAAFLLFRDDAPATNAGIVDKSESDAIEDAVEAVVEASLSDQPSQYVVQDAVDAYLNAISEVCDGGDEAKPTKPEECGEVISNYLDALSTGAVQSSSTDAGSGIIASYLDSLSPSRSSSSFEDGREDRTVRVAAVTAYLNAVSSGATASPSRESIVSYLGAVSTGEEPTASLESLTELSSDSSVIDKTLEDEKPDPLKEAALSEAYDVQVSHKMSTIPASPSSSSYLDALSEVCVPERPMGQCVEAVKSYLDSLPPTEINITLVDQRAATPRISTYLDTLSGWNSGENMVSTDDAFQEQPHSEVDSMSTEQYAVLSQSFEDVALENWYKRHGIASGRVQVRTTDESIGGRGLFWSSDKKAVYGDVLARIPSNCVLAASSSRMRWPELMDWNQIDDPSLQMIMSAICAYKHGGGEEVDWPEWIDTWLGRGGIEPRPLSCYSSEDIQSLASAAGTSFAETSMAIEIRYNLFKTEAFKLGFSLTEDADGPEGLTTEQFTDIWTVVVSRCANLGPQWEYERGIVPLHDMLNHPPYPVESSVELHSLGDLKPHIPVVEQVHRLVHMSGVEKASPPLDDKDILLVARRDISPGEELFLSYRDSSKADEMTGEERLYIIFQYGFPLR